ncbi:uncharacterized protein [Chelonus insularis]|uniref:uncharacterized protein n=1 Tax=Chelonus insularis TaxID=460826 RepID=UPI00158A9EE8|nr:uncharacterized protein LOC118069178 [Chelonus insularis]
MSRASQGGLEVERYIGSCLISSTVRPNNIQKTIVKKELQSSQRNNSHCYTQNNYSTGNDQRQYGTWTGAPLISMTSSPRRNNQRSSPSPCQQQHSPVESQHQQTHQQVSSHLQSRSPLSRLAIHTQGAPLILAGRYHSRGKISNSNIIASANVNNFCNVNNNTMSIGRCAPVRNQKTIAEVSRKCQPQQHQQQQQQPQPQQQQINQKNDCQNAKLDSSSGTSIANIDSLSITSDESSNNCENSLPRIIKPRKRRKKDRKPTNVIAPENSKPEDQPVTTNSGLADQSSVVSLKPYVPICYETRYEPPAHRAQRRPPVCRESYGRTQAPMQEIVDTRQRYAHRHAQVKVLDDNRNIVPVLVRTTGLTKGYRNHHHRHPVNNAINRAIHNENGPRYIHNYDTCEKVDIIDDPGSCQCRYCNPSGLIWDVDQDGYSPFLTPPSTSTGNDFVQISQIPLFLSRSTLGCQEHGEYYDVDDPLRGHHHHHHHHHHHQIPVGSTRHERLESTGGVLLRRSWSDPSSYFSEQISTPSRDVGVIGDRGQPTEIGRGRSSWPGSPSYVSLGINASGLSALANPASSSQSLEVSTEIVTSHNGHRDLEIKFFSSSPSAVQPEEDKSPFIDDNEDYSDIWSYHESKLQQDFRTLLQAEE